MKRTVKYKFPVGYNLVTTREELRGLFEKELHPNSPKIAIINDMFEKGYKFGELPFIVSVRIEKILCKTDFNNNKERILYYCTTRYSTKGLYINEERLFKMSDKSIIEEIEHDSDKPLGASGRIKLFQALSNLEKRYDKTLSVEVDLPVGLVLEEGAIPDNSFFSSTDITNPIFINIGKHDIAIDENEDISVKFITLQIYPHSRL